MTQNLRSVWYSRMFCLEKLYVTTMLFEARPPTLGAWGWEEGPAVPQPGDRSEQLVAPAGRRGSPASACGWERCACFVWECRVFSRAFSVRALPALITPGVPVGLHCSGFKSREVGVLSKWIWMCEKYFSCSQILKLLKILSFFFNCLFR